MRDNLNPGGPDMGNDGTGTRKTVVVVIALLLLAMVGGGYVLYQRSKAPTSTASEEPPPVAETSEKPPVTPRPPDPTPPVPPSQVSASASATARVVPASTTNAAIQDPNVSPYARKIITALRDLHMTNGPMTPEKLAAWKSTLQMLTNQGP